MHMNLQGRCGIGSAARLLACALATLAFVPVAAGARSSGANLLNNPSFENGLTGWTAVSSSATVVSYGAANAPSVSMGTHIGGGARFLRDLGGNAVVEQVVALGSVAPGSQIRAGGFFGGLGNDDSRLVVRFLDGLDGELQRQNLDYVTDVNRNFESVLMRRERILEIPSGTASVAARIELRNSCCGSVLAAADAVYLELLPRPVEPAPLPLGTQLLNNPGFEDGWTGGSPLSLTDLRGWEGIGPGSSRVKPYSDSDPLVPGTVVSCVIGGASPAPPCLPGGGGNLLSDFGGNGAMRQRLDLRGNATELAQPGGLELHVSAMLGGVGGLHDRARIDVRFLNAASSPIGVHPALGPVTRAMRNSETVLMLRERAYEVPPDACYVEVDVAFTNECCGDVAALADNVTAVLRNPNPVPLLALNTNLVDNGSFEASSLPASPLQLLSSAGWVGVNDSKVETLAYGASSAVPSSSFAAEHGLGGLLAGDLGGNAGLRYEWDLVPDQTLVDAGRLRMNAEAWLGGVGSSNDRAEVRIQFTNLAGVQVGGADGFQLLPAVTAAERGNVTTLIQRTEDFPVPPLARRVSLELRFINECCGEEWALADEIRLVAYDVLVGGPVLYPGSGEDLVLLSGVNSFPTGGPGNDFLMATAFDVLNLEVVSPGGTFDFAPLMILANAYPTGTTPPGPPAGFLPGLVVGFSGLVFLVDGVLCNGLGCPAIVPGGTPFSIPVPVGLSGVSLLIQALALPAPGQGPPAANGLFAGSDGHVVEIF